MAIPPVRRTPQHGSPGPGPVRIQFPAWHDTSCQSSPPPRGYQAPDDITPSHEISKFQSLCTCQHAWYRAMVASLMHVGSDPRAFQAQLEILAVESSQYAWRTSLPHVSDTPEQRAIKKAHLLSLFEVGDQRGIVGLDGVGCMQRAVGGYNSCHRCCLEVAQHRCVWNLDGSANGGPGMPAPMSVHQQERLARGRGPASDPCRGAFPTPRSHPPHPALGPPRCRLCPRSSRPFGG